jgi:hypothetical protein
MTEDDSKSLKTFKQFKSFKPRKRKTNRKSALE